MFINFYFSFNNMSVKQLNYAWPRCILKGLRWTVDPLDGAFPENERIVYNGRVRLSRLSPCWMPWSAPCKRDVINNGLCVCVCVVNRTRTHLPVVGLPTSRLQFTTDIHIHIDCEGLLVRKSSVTSGNFLFSSRAHYSQFYN